MFKFEIIDNNSSVWNETVKRAFVYDFYHTAYFHKIDSDFNSKLLVFSDGDNFIALPVVIRPIEGTDYFDITSVYGYSGPVYNFEKKYSKADLVAFFRTNFLDYCNKHKIVSVFSRLHPLIDQSCIIESLGELANLNKTVSINLTSSAQEQRKEFRKSLKSELNQLRRKGVFVREATSQEDVDQFVAIYYETMDRVNAHPNYYFSKDYFREFLNNSDFDSKLLLAIKEDKIIAGAIITLTEKIMQYHLAGTAEAFIRDTPMKLILDEARLLGASENAGDLHLGGGVGGQDGDSLFRFKSGFSKRFKQFSVWRYIVNEKIYNQLSQGKPPSSYFPLYRS